MFKKYRKMLIGSFVIASFLIAITAYAANPNYFLKRGNTITLLKNSWVFGSASHPITNGRFTDLTVDTLTVGAIVITGSIDMGGYNISNADIITAAKFIATSTEEASIFPLASSTQITVDTDAWLAVSGGRVGIGTANPSQLLHMVGDGTADTGWARFGLSTTEYTEIGHRGSNSAINAVGDGNLDFRHDNNTKMTLTDAGYLGISTSTPAYDLDVYGNIRADGDIRTIGTFYGDNWTSITANSMNIKPTGDVDDFFSFKTPTHRPTIKREGGKFIYFESSNVYDVGISFRADATYSGTLNYEKDGHLMTMLGKASPLGFKANSDYDDYIKIQTTSNTPEITVASSSALKINAGGTNSLLFNHSGGNVGIGTSSPNYILDVYGNARIDGVLILDGLTLGVDENITLGAQTLDHDGTDFNFNDSVDINDGTHGVRIVPGTATTSLIFY